MAARSVSVKLLLDAVSAALRDHDDLFEGIASMVKEDAKKAFEALLEDVFSASNDDGNCLVLVVALAIFYRHKFDVRLEQLFADSSEQ
jgi:hypothetical protein